MDHPAKVVFLAIWAPGVAFFFYVGFKSHRGEWSGHDMVEILFCPWFWPVLLPIAFALAVLKVGFRWVNAHWGK
jgi:hypothetical protein